MSLQVAANKQTNKTQAIGKVKVMAFTRQQYMARECTHQEYYAQFVTPSIRGLVAAYIGTDMIKRSTDPHFNDIPLRLWDSLQDCIRPAIAAKMRELDKGGISLSDCVCVAKQAAREIKAVS